MITFEQGDKILAGPFSAEVRLRFVTFALWLAVAFRVAACQSGGPVRGNEPDRRQLDFEETHQPAKEWQQQQHQQQQQIDLVALNMRRFELDHHHPQHYTPNGPRVAVRKDFATDADLNSDLLRGQLIEAQIAALPEQILNRLPEDMTKQLVESMSADPSLMGLTRQAHELSMAVANEEDPDGASVERLTKSCLTVQASSLPADQQNVTFHLYTRRNPSQAYVMGSQVGRDEILTRSPFRRDKPLKWITHGFHTNLDKSEWMLTTKDKILAHEDANVILTDWRRGASPALAFYPKAAANAHVVAKMIVRILRRLSNDIQLNRVHLVGHSLGAHIMGFVGSAFTEEYLQQQQLQLNGDLQPKTIPSALIGRITACDPALPCFGSSSSGPNGGRRPHRTGSGAQVEIQQAGDLSPSFSPDDFVPALWTHLRPDSAILVEVMHSNPGVMGYAEPLGDFDFFPNGSDRQPGCSGGSSASNMTQTHAKWPPPPPSPPPPPPPSNNYQVDSKPTHERFTSRARSSVASRLTQTLSQFIKPIRDFFHAYTCSHHRSVEYMVESIYYEQAINPKQVCQMVAYRCQDYQSFKRGFCFTCRNDLECRSFGMSFSGSDKLSTEIGYAPTLINQFAAVVPTETPQQRAKRILPTLNQYGINYKPNTRNQYYFDTQASGESYCLNHYHFLIKYRWFRIRESISVERLRLIGSQGGDIARESSSVTVAPSSGQEIKFNRFSQNTYTMLLTMGNYLGRLETLLIYDNQLKPHLIEYVDVSYLSNLDAQIRSMSSARFCLVDSVSKSSERHIELAHSMNLDELKQEPIHVFVRCNPSSRSV